MVGCYFAMGLLSISDETQAAHHFQLAADGGIVDAQYNLGVCLLNGKGLEKSEPEAFNYFKLAADEGHADAKAATAKTCTRGE